MAKEGFRLGALAQDHFENIIVLKANTSVSKYSSMLDKNGSAYQVTAGKTLYIGHIYTFNGSANGGLNFGYGSAAVSESAGAPSGWKQVSEVIMIAVANVGYPINVLLPVPAANYPCVIAIGGSGYATCFCVEL